MQLPLPGLPRRNRDPQLELERIEHDKKELRHDLRMLLDSYAANHEIGARTVNEVMLGYANGLIDDFFYERKTELEDEVDEALEREDWPYGRPT